MSISYRASRSAQSGKASPCAAVDLQSGLMNLIGAAGEALGVVREYTGGNQRLDIEHLTQVMWEMSGYLEACEEAMERMPESRSMEAPRGVVRLHAASDGPTFLQFADACLSETEYDRAPGTLNNLRRAVAYTEHTFGQIRIIQVDEGAVRRHLEAYQAGVLPGQLRPPAVSTCNEHFSMLHHIFAMAEERGVILRSPMHGMRKARRANPNKQAQALDEAEAQRLIRCLNEEHPMWRAMVLLMMDTGARRGETVGAQWEDIDFVSGRMTICHNRQYTPGLGVYTRCPKSGKARTVYINAYALSAMKSWRDIQKDAAKERGRDAPAYCFTGSEGEPVHPQSATRYLETLACKYGFARLHPHMLRHTMATLSIAHGADVVSVSKKLGHARTSLTLDVYSHANAEAQRRANQALSQALYE